MRNFLIPIFVALALIYGAGGLAAQGPERVASESFQIPTPVLPVGPVAIEAPSLQNRILSGIAAAVLGAGIGYFASQVATGDWEEGEMIVSQFAGEPTLDAQGNLYLTGGFSERAIA